MRLLPLRPALVAAAGIVVSSLLLIGFVEFAEGVFADAFAAADAVTLAFLRGCASPALDRLMALITRAGSAPVLGAAFLPAAVLLALRRQWLDFTALALSLGGGAYLNYLLKVLYHRPRPDVPWAPPEAGFAFPSGHAMVSLTFYGMAAYLVVRRVLPWPKGWPVILLAVLLVGLIGLSRLYLGVHWLTDVIGGYLAGAVWLTALISARHTTVPDSR